MASLAYHLQLPLAGGVVVETAVGALNREIAGDLVIGDLDYYGWDEVRARGVVMKDPQGREVIRAAQVRAIPDWSALWSGTIRVSRAHLRGGEVTLHVSGEEDETVSLVEAFLPANPSPVPGRPPPHILVDGIVLEDVLVRGDVPGFADQRYENVRLNGRIETVGRAVRFSVFDGHGVMTGPYRGRTYIDRIVGRFSTDLEHEGLRFFARARRGEDRVRAQIVLTRPDLTAAPVMDLRARAEPVRISTLREMEVAPGLDALEGTVRGRARLWGSTDDLQLWADLTSSAGQIIVRGRLPREGTLHLEGATNRLQLSELIPRAPRTVVAGEVALDLEPVVEGEAQTRRLHADVSPLSIGGVAIPGFTMEGQLEDEALVITELDATHAGGETLARGRVGFDGSLDVHVRADLPDVGDDPNVARHAGGTHGALFAELDIRADERAENLRADGHIVMRNARFGSVRAAHLDVRGHAGGELPAPNLELEGNASSLRMGALSLGRAHVTIEGGPEGYTIDAYSIDEESGTELRVAGRATSSEDGVRLDAPDVLVNVGDGPWRGNVGVRFRPGESVELDPLVLSRDSERVAVTGTYRFDGNDDIDVELTNVDLEHARPLAPEALAGLGGRVDGRVHLGGDLDRRPQGRLTARVRDGRFRGLRDIDGRVELDLTGERLDTDVRLDLGASGQLVAEGPIRVPPSALRDPETLLDRATFDGLRVRADNLDVGPMLAVAGLSDDVRVAGRITTDAELTGTARRPGLRDAVLVLDRILLEGWDPLRAKLHLNLGDDRLVVRHAWVADSGGELATGEADLPFALDDVPGDLTELWRTLRSEPWAVSMRIAQRRLDGWPNPQAESMPPGLSASASITAGGDGQTLTADFDAVGRFVEAAVDDPCAAELRPLTMVRGRLEGDLVTATVNGFFGGERADMTADVAAVLPLDEWVQQGGVDEFPSTEIVARLHGVDMGDVPWLCNYGRGPMHGRLTAKDLLTGRSVVGALLDLPRFAIWSMVGERGERRLSNAYRASVRFGSSPERDALTACAVLGESGTVGTPGEACRETTDPAAGELISRIRVPVRWNAGSLLPEYVDGERITSWSSFDHVHVEPVLTFIPGIVSGDAIVNGDVRVAGPWEDLRLAGALDLSEGHLQIEGLGQHLFDIAGRLELREHELIFPQARPVVAFDGGGSARAHGTITFDGLVPSAVALELTTQNFPIRSEGMVLASLTGIGSIAGTITEDELRSTITTRSNPSASPQEFVISLPDQSGGSLQSLEEHGDIVIVGEERPGGDASGESYPIIVNIDAQRPFRVRRDDFTAIVSAQLEAIYRDPHLTVGGRARILRGTFEIFGKRFELQSNSELVFDPTDRQLDPDVSITAVYQIPGRTGATVTVRVTGTLTEPVVEFQSTESGDRAEIIALLIAGGRREAGAAERQVSEQAASFLAGITAGILTLGLREEFGDVIPMLAIESEGASGTRVRIGIDANELIPDFARDFVTGMYIEGFVSGAADGTNAAGTSSGGGGFGGGVTIELTLPENVLLRGTYVPIDNGSIDVLYEP